MANSALAGFLILLLFFMCAMSLGKAEEEDIRKPYIIHMIKSMKPQHFYLHQHWYASMLSQVSESNANELLYTYDTLLHGFAARLSEAEADAMESMEGCLAVVPSSLNKVATTHTPEFLGLSSSSSSSPGLWSQYSTGGEDIIVGVIDTGIWPESKSFNDAGLGPVPSRWKGTCESGQAFNSSHCNRKIIGARYFYKGFQNNVSKINETLEYMSPRDAHGHGTHTASTAAGAAVTGASLLGFASGTARGMAPHARLAIYKACWAPEGRCDDSDVAAAMEHAIADGVDILSISISSEDVPFHMNIRAIAAFGATEKGVFVSAAAGNRGPLSSTLSNTEPWITTVGASSIDRDFPASLVLGNQEIYRGTSAFKGGDGKLQGPFPLVYVSASNSSKRCLDGSLDPNLVKDKIVLCDQLIDPDDSSAPEKANEVARAGGAGMIVANEELLGAQQQFSYTFKFPAISLSFKAGEKIKSYINSTSNTSTATAAMRLTGLTIVGNATAAPIVAAFSSRGPSEAYPSVLKPDMIAPGVNILAAYAGSVDYILDSGTSMACPHVSGIAALIKAIHPTWSPAAIKSALMTSSYIVDNRKQEIRDSVTMEAANPFAMGSGHVDPRSAMDPGLVYDMAPQDYIDFLCSLNYTKKQIALLTKRLISCPKSSFEAGDLNYPSFSVVFKPGNNSAQVSRRTVTNVGAVAKGNVVYRASVKSPPGVSITVEPQTFVFRNLYDKATYIVKFESNIRTPSPSEGDQNGFGEISWTCIEGGRQLVRSPIVLTWQASN
ncbi:hypothetical protein SUGI_1489020 [Cryptomeria japonica]|uniref:Uncharacterized protein n=1 Tax=Cryptomeria japonica TaxID=3369 RepID=A0AAD3NSC9_CRYJA|nr:subtilisin-like protease SBT1.7 [Cryptomeria japonica]GLJ59029.1 hypothetical protein SUGI_1489020 [Cryptomeria japonica]